MDNYKEVKNYIHNELKISKDDIQALIQSEIKNQISALLLDQSFVDSMIRTHISQLLKDKNYDNPRYRTITDINSFIYDGLITELGRVVHDNIKIKVGLKTDNLEFTPLDDCNKSNNFFDNIY